MRICENEIQGCRNDTDYDGYQHQRRQSKVIKSKHSVHFLVVLKRRICSPSVSCTRQWDSSAIICKILSLAVVVSSKPGASTAKLFSGSRLIADSSLLVVFRPVVAACAVVGPDPYHFAVNSAHHKWGQTEFDYGRGFQKGFRFDWPLLSCA